MQKRKGFRDGVEIEDVLKLTPEERKLIRKQREFGKLKPDTWSYKVAVYCDEIRTNIRTYKSTISKRLWTIRQYQNEIARLKEQLVAEDIRETLPRTDILLNANEMNVLISRSEWAIETELQVMPADLGNLRINVGHLTNDQKFAMTEEEFDGYIEKIRGEIKSLGYSFLD